MILNIFEKYLSNIKNILQIIIVLSQLALVLYFINFGYEFSSSSYYVDIRTALYGILLTVIIVIGFFVVNFSGGFDFNDRPEIPGLLRPGMNGRL